MKLTLLRHLAGAALLSSGLILSPLAASRVHAIIGGCGGDPVVTLSNGVQLDLSTIAAGDTSTVQQIRYTLHVPTGTYVVSVTELGVREVLIVADDNPPQSYTTVTRVDATAALQVTATTTVVAPISGVATGAVNGGSNENLRIDFTF